MLAVLSAACAARPSPGETPAAPVGSAGAVVAGELRPVDGALDAVLAAVDRDGDRRVTVLDGPGLAFDLPLVGGGTYRVEGTYALANLVQELKLAADEGRATIAVERLVENPVDRLGRLVRERYWDALTRRIDRGSLATVLPDPKMDERRGEARSYAGSLEGCTPSQNPSIVPWFLWVAPDDPAAFAYYAGLAREEPRLIVCPLPERVTPAWVRDLTGGGARGSRHGLLALASQDGVPLPYVVPGGRFNELYGWDSYFHVLGLVHDGRPELARAVVDSLAYEVRHYGKILNANRTYYLTRSQPPFLSSMVSAVWEAVPTATGSGWLRERLDAVIEEYERIWTAPPRRTDVCRDGSCLSRYYGEGLGPPPEVEPGHFRWLYEPRARAAGLAVDEYERRVLDRSLPASELAELDRVFVHDRCMRESGHDTTYRWFDVTTGEDRCADFATVDLNALLLKTELDVARLLKTEFGGELERPGRPGGTPSRETAANWCERARRRAALLREHLWDPEAGLFFDLDLRTGKRGGVVSATALYPLWAIAGDTCGVAVFADERDPARLVAATLRALEQPGGLSATARPSRPLGPPRQWEYPNGWAPHQILAWHALRAHGFVGDADRLTWRWLAMIVENARDYHGTVPEKYDVVARTHRVFAEYGNVNTEFSYIATEGFGWMNASISLGLAALPPALHEALRDAAASAAPIPDAPPGAPNR